MVSDSLSIVIPCLNESATIATCISRAKGLLHKLAMPGEVLVVDNGSIDTSRQIAIDEGARLIVTSEKGYGSALHAGISSATGNLVLFGDGDDSYHFDEAGPLIEKKISCRQRHRGWKPLPGWY